MRDRALRAAEHRLQADPDDQDALQQAILARQRTGVPVPGWMHAQSRWPARSLRLSVPVDVGALLPDGRSIGLGRTGESPLQIPEHRTFWITPPTPSDLGVQDLAAELVAESVPGLSLGPDLSDAGLRALAPLAEHLTYLDLGGCSRITSEGLAELRSLSCLATLRLWNSTPTDDEGLLVLGGIKGLSSLDLSHCSGFREESLEALAGLEELSVLRLDSCRQVRDLGVGLLRRLSRLSSLDLSRCGLTDAGLAALAESSELAVLNLAFCDALTPEGLRPLAELPSLRQLCVVGCELDPDAVEALFADSGCEVRL